MLTDEQLAARKLGIGGSEVGALVGLNPFAGPFEIYMNKTEGRAFEGNAHTERGEFLEDGTAKWWAHRNKAELSNPGTIRHPTKAIVMCTPDRLAKFADGSMLDLSVKVPSRRSQEHWGEPGTDDVPEAYLAQVQWELFILEELVGIREAVIVAPFDDLACYPVKADPELQGMLVDAAEKFWRDHVEPRRPPPVDGSDFSSEYLQKRFPKATRPVVRAPDEGEKIARELARTKAAFRGLCARKDELENRLCELIGDASGIEGEGWRANWTEVGESQVKATVRKAYRRLNFSGKGLERET